MLCGRRNMSPYLRTSTRMPIIPQVGRKAIQVRALIALLYVVLILGAVTMVYPFLLMLSTSITSSTDTNEFRVIPRYLYDEGALFAKYADDRYAGDIDAINDRYHTDYTRVEDVRPDPDAFSQGSRDLVKVWQKTVSQLPSSFQDAGFRGYGAHPSQLTLAYQAFVRKRFDGRIELLNRTYTEENEDFQTVRPPMERSTSREWVPDGSPKVCEFLRWKEALPASFRVVAATEPLFARFLREDTPEYRGRIADAARVWGPAADFSRIALPALPPSNPARRRDWERFVRTRLPLRYLALAPAALPAYRTYLQKRYHTVADLNEAHNTACTSFDEVQLPGSSLAPGRPVLDLADFIKGPAPLSAVHIDTPESRLRSTLQEMEASHAALPAGCTPGSIATVQPPYHAEDTLYVHSHASELRRDYITRNYRLVVDYILLHGRAVWVTLIFCLGVIATTLIVNPLCAYALSRYSLPYGYKVLLFLLATMAFPAEVAMIPNFLLLKQLQLLNTFWALILPGMASGFSIFLMKGFFDSLPRELYEAGTIDGSSELRMFFQITLPLSKPIFAVIALQAFTGAYGAFMFAFLVCQNSKMWTIMVWLYELQIVNPQYIMMAALTVAAMPTLLVFLFAQNVIMRGIILPSMK